jgi:hypothetical protein
MYLVQLFPALMFCIGVFRRHMPSWAHHSPMNHLTEHTSNWILLHTFTHLTGTHEPVPWINSYSTITDITYKAIQSCTKRNISWIVSPRYHLHHSVLKTEGWHTAPAPVLIYLQYAHLLLYYIVHTTCKHSGHHILLIGNDI